MLPPDYGAIVVNSVSKWYPGNRRKDSPLQALDDVSMTLSRGDLGILLGASGCGKSTLLRMVAGLENIDQGDIRVSGKPVVAPGRDRGMVFQSYTSFPWLTVEQNVAYGLKINADRSSEREGAVGYYLEQVGLSQFRNSYPEQLSGGMKQRVAIARALANQPAVLLMDEPFGALDPETRNNMQELLLGIARRERMTVLMVTHDVEEALFLGDAITFLSSRPGRVKEYIVPDFGSDKDTRNKSAFKALPAFAEMDDRIRHMMREESDRSHETLSL